ncbi:MAG: hypothetical protein J2O44_03365 [Porphyrobacter sp.]|nr:hypothetical protein [Porphyrobacter sp.]
MKATFALLAGLGLASCATTPAPTILRVAAVAPHIGEWDGRVVEVRGWLHGCHGGFDCTIDTQRSRDRDDNVSLILDFVRAVEPSLGDADGRQVLLRARVTDECVVNICTDRAPALIPIELLEVH